MRRLICCTRPRLTPISRAIEDTGVPSRIIASMSNVLSERTCTGLYVYASAIGCNLDGDVSSASA